MSTRKIRAAVNGYGVIGKRIADAIAAQDDMELVGVADVVCDWRIQVAVAKGYRTFGSTPQALEAMGVAGMPIVGTLDDLLKQVDVIADATPKKVAAANLEKYRAANVKSIFQGGEKHGLTGHSFVAQANYATALGRDTTRVVSCNTTSIVRTLGALKNAGLLNITWRLHMTWRLRAGKSGSCKRLQRASKSPSNAKSPSSIKRARGVLVRRATDPWESDHSGVMNTVVPERDIPSHQGPDAQTVIPDLDVVTIAVVAAHTTSHLHAWSVELTRAATRDEVLAAFRAAPRIAFLRANDGVVALNNTIEMMADLGRPRGDMWEVGLWEDSLTVKGNEAFYNYQVYNQAIVVPENIDAIRALTSLEKDGAASIAKTDGALGLRHKFL